MGLLRPPARSSMEPSDPASFAALAAHIIAGIDLVSSFDVAAITILAYDYSLTFSTEVSHVWRRTVTPITLLFFLVRYVPFIDSSLLLLHESLRIIRPSTYGILLKAQTWTNVISLLSAHVILLLRTCAIWSNKRSIIIGLITLLVGIAGSAGYFGMRYNDSLGYTKNPFASTPPFLITTVDTKIFALYILFLSFETVILALTLWKAKQQGGKSTIYQILYRDCVLFYLFLLTVSLINIILLTMQTDSAKKVLVTQLHKTFHSVVLGRVVLNIRQAIAGRQRQSEVDNTSTLLYGDGSFVTV